jgi:uncharacterized protein YqgV (UPF0045/DUF77 family)
VAFTTRDAEFHCSCAGLKKLLKANGTNSEGESYQVFAAVEKRHEVAHEMGAPSNSTKTSDCVMKSALRRMASVVEKTDVHSMPINTNRNIDYPATLHAAPDGAWMDDEPSSHYRYGAPNGAFAPGPTNPFHRKQRGTA